MCKVVFIARHLVHLVLISETHLWWWWQ